MDDLIETAELETFLCIVDTGSLSKAAVELNVPRATVGRRLERLEERLSVRLIRRTTRKLLLTEAGEALYQRAQVAMTAIRDATASVRRTSDAIRGTLRVAVPPMNARRLNELICGFLVRYPQVELQLYASSAFVNFTEQGYDLALRAGAVDPGLVSRLLMRTRTFAVASRDYLARRGSPQSAKDLVDHSCLLGFGRGAAPNHYWPLLNGESVRVDGPLATNDLGMLRDAARVGLGITVLPEFFVQHLVETGDGVIVLPDEVGGSSPISVVYPEREYMPPAVRAFIDMLVDWTPKAFSPAQIRETTADLAIGDSETPWSEQ